MAQQSGRRRSDGTRGLVGIRSETLRPRPFSAFIEDGGCKGFEKVAR